MKNQKGISLIALIITIIVIIILAVVVIAGASNTPEQARFATWCQDYDTIQSAVLTAYASRMAQQLGQESSAKAYSYVATGTEVAAADADPTGDVAITNWSGLGIEEPTKYAQTWNVDVTTGKLTCSPGFSYDGDSYPTPAGPAAAAPANP